MWHEDFHVSIIIIYARQASHPVPDLSHGTTCTGCLRLFSATAATNDHKVLSIPLIRDQLLRSDGLMIDSSDSKDQTEKARQFFERRLCQDYGKYGVRRVIAWRQNHGSSFKKKTTIVTYAQIYRITVCVGWERFISTCGKNKSSPPSGRNAFPTTVCTVPLLFSQQ